jgi:hypothetical protein
MKDLNHYGVTKGVYADDCLVDRVMKNKIYIIGKFSFIFILLGESLLG